MSDDHLGTNRNDARYRLHDRDTRVGVGDQSELLFELLKQIDRLNQIRKLDVQRPTPVFPGRTFGERLTQISKLRLDKLLGPCYFAASTLLRFAPSDSSESRFA